MFHMLFLFGIISCFIHALCAKLHSIPQEWMADEVTVFIPVEFLSKLPTRKDLVALYKLISDSFWYILQKHLMMLSNG